MDSEETTAFPIAEYAEHYSVSTNGNIISIRTGKRLRQSLVKGDHPVFVVSNNGHTKMFSTSKIVALAFLGNQPKFTMVGHFDGDSKNCSLSNLFWMSVFDPRARGNGARKYYKCPCGQPHSHHGLCSRHARHWQRAGRPDLYKYKELILSGEIVSPLTRVTHQPSIRACTSCGNPKSYKGLCKECRQKQKLAIPKKPKGIKQSTAEIIALRGKMAVPDIAIRYGVSKSRVYQIFKNHK